MLKRFSLVLLIILTGCNQTATIVNTIPNSTPTPLSSVATSSPNPVSSNSPSQSLTPSPSPTINQSTAVKSISAFPNYLVLKEGETRNIYSQIKMINGSFNNNFTITSSDESIAKIENNTLIAIKEGLTSIKVISKDDTTKNFVIPVEVQDVLSIYKIKSPDEYISLSYTQTKRLNFDLDSDNKLLIKYYYDKKLGNYNSNLNLGYQNWNVIPDETFYPYTNSKINSVISRTDRSTKNDNNKEMATYNLYVDIYENNNLKKTIKINEKPFVRDETNNLTRIIKVFNSSISTDMNNNFVIVWYNQDKEYKARYFNKDGDPISPKVTLYTVDRNINSVLTDEFFGVDVSPNSEKIIFSKYSQDSLLVKVFDKDLKKVYEKNTVKKDDLEGVNKDLSHAMVSINDLGEYVIGWISWSQFVDNKYEIYFNKYDMNSQNIIKHNFKLSGGPNSILGLSINNNSNIIIGFSYRKIDGGDTLGIRYFPGDKNKDYINLKRGQTYKLNTKYSKYVSSNDSVVTIKDSELIAQDLGTATINGFDENDYEKNITLKVNVSL